VVEVPDVDPELLAAAERALEPVLGTVALVATQALRGSDRSRVVRAVARTAEGGEHRLVVKAPTGSGLGAVREAAALTVAARSGLPGPVRLLASSDDPPLLVLADAGAGPTLADHLLRRDAARAEAALLRWAAALGGLQAASTGCGAAFEAELATLSPFGAPPADTMPGDLEEASGALRRLLPRLGVAPPEAALEELRGVAGSFATAAGGLVPGDTCPDNAVDTEGGVVLLDFEAAAHRHVAWEAAYLVVPWPTCWCSWRLPADVAARAVEAWRDAVATALPVVRAPDFDADLARATIAWVFLSAGWLLEAALGDDPPPRAPERAGLMPTRRAMIQHRLSLAAGLDTPVLPGLRALAERLHDASVTAWGWAELRLAPAFR
jgi:hypothetical protein